MVGFRVLGQVTTTAGPVVRAQARRILALLLVNRNRPVSADAVADALFGDSAPNNASSAVQTNVSRLRSLIGKDSLSLRPAGYVLSVHGNACDADQFEGLIRTASSLNDSPAVLATLEQAIQLWGGRPFAEFAAEEFARTEVARLEQLHATACELRLDALLGCGRAADAVTASESVLAAYPYREGVWAVRMRAMAATGRHVDAIRAYQSYREMLAEETGLVPSAALAALERQLVAAADALGAPPVRASFGADGRGSAVVRDSTRRTGSDGSAGRRTPGEQVGWPASAGTRERAAVAQPRPTPWMGRITQGVELVARRDELALLERCFAVARNGDPQLVTVTGVAGMGKSTLLDAFTRRLRAGAAPFGLGSAGGLFGSDSKKSGGSSDSGSASSTSDVARASSATNVGSGGLTSSKTSSAEIGRRSSPALVPIIATGTCLEDGGLPLAPFRSVITALAAASRDADSEPGLSGGGVGVAAPITSGPAEERGALIVDAIIGASQERPVVVMIDDCHWIDNATIDVLVMLVARAAHEADSVRLLLVLAHRPDGSETRIDPRLAKLGREPMSRNADLAVFDEPEIGELITALTGQSAAPRLLADLVLASSGVPLLVGAALRSLRDDRRLAIVDGSLTTTGDIPIALPSDVLAAVSPIFSVLAPSTRELLEHAALLGADVPIELVATATGLSVAVVVDTLGDAEDGGVARIVDRRCRFEHDLYRQAFLVEMTESTRQRRRLQIADRLDGSVGRVGLPGAGPPTDSLHQSNSSEPAHHQMADHQVADPERTVLIADLLARSGPLADKDRIALWAARAGKVCTDNDAWADAARHYERALANARGLTDDEWIDLHLGAGLAKAYTFDIGALAHLEQVVTYASAIPDYRRWGEAELMIHRIILNRKLENAEPHRFQRFIEAAAENVPDIQARMWSALAEEAFQSTRLELGSVFGERAMERARDAGDPALEAEVSFGDGLIRLGLLELDTAGVRFRSVLQAESASAFQKNGALRRLAIVNASLGRYEEALAQMTEAASGAHRLNAWGELALGSAYAAGILALARGPSVAEVQAVEALRLATRSAYAVGVPIALSALLWARCRLGNEELVEATLDAWAERRAGDNYRYRILALLTTSRGPEARSLLDQRPLHYRSQRPISFFNATAASTTAEIAVRTGDVQLAKQVLPAIRQLDGKGLLIALGWPIFLPGVLASLAELLMLKLADQLKIRAQSIENNLRVPAHVLL